MEKLLAKHRKILAAFLPKAASSAVLSFQVSPPVSPVGKGSSSSPVVVSLIPKEARRKSRNGSFDAREPASPKVSCMGQIKCTKSKNRKKKHGAGKSKVASASPPPQATVAGEVKRKGDLIKERKRGHESNVSDSQAKVADATRVPSVGKMKQFSSARGTLSGFDWRACECDAAEEAVGVMANPLYEEKEGKSEIVEEPRLWNRRTTTRLTPLRL